MVNYMFLWMAGAALFLTIFYFYVNRKKKSIPFISEQKLENFISSNTFAGAKRGYVFKKDELGIGYYLDKLSS